MISILLVALIAEPSTAVVEPPKTTSASVPVKKKLVCRRDAQAGSRIAPKKRCVTVEQARDEEERARESMEEAAKLK